MLMAESKLNDGALKLTPPYLSVFIMIKIIDVVSNAKGAFSPLLDLQSYLSVVLISVLFHQSVWVFLALDSSSVHLVRSVISFLSCCFF